MDRRNALLDLLQALRRQALAGGLQRLGSHQLDAHLSIAYACQQPPESWELYQVPRLHLMPQTGFYAAHAPEIQEALRPAATWDLLCRHAVPKLAMQAAMSEQECKAFGYPGNVQYHDGTRWCPTDAQQVPWFDGRELIRDALLKAEHSARQTASTLNKAKAWGKSPSAGRLDQLEKGAGAAQQRLQEVQAWLAKLDTTPDFAKAVFTLLRRAENDVRRAMEIPAVGEGWVSEAELLYRVRCLLPGVEVVSHGRPQWLPKGQHLDIWLPDRLIAVEYQGITHFKAVEHFGGAAALEHRQRLDARKREACARSGVRLIEVAYDQKVDDAALLAALERR